MCKLLVSKESWIPMPQSRFNVVHSGGLVAELQA